MTKTLTAGAFWLLLALAAIGATSILSPAGTVAYAALAAYAGILWVRARHRPQKRLYSNGETYSETHELTVDDDGSWNSRRIA